MAAKQTEPKKSGLSEQVGPLPLWGWGALCLAAWYVYQKYSGSSSGATSSSSTPSYPSTNPTVFYIPPPSSGGGAGGPSPTPAPPPGTTPGPTPTAPGTIPTNQSNAPVHLQPGEKIIGTVPNPKGKGLWYISNFGGVFSEGGAPYYGSYLGLPPKDRQGQRTFTTASPNAYGGYTLISNTGQLYQFGPPGTPYQSPQWTPKGYVTL